MGGVEFPSTGGTTGDLIQLSDSKTAEYTDSISLAGLTLAGVTLPSTAGTFRQVIAMDASGTSASWSNANITQQTILNTNTTLTAAQILGPTTYLISPPAGTTTITLPLASSLSGAGLGGTEMVQTAFVRDYTINPTAVVELALSGSDTFYNTTDTAYNRVYMSSCTKAFTITANPTTGYAKMECMRIGFGASVSTPGAVPPTTFATIPFNVYNSVSPAFFTNNGNGTYDVLVGGVYTITYHAFLISTGGSTYNSFGRVLINGVVEPDGNSYFRNFSNEDAILTEYFTIRLAAGDTIDIQYEVEATFVGTLQAATANVMAMV